MLLIYTPEISSRIQFTFEFVFKDLLNLNYKLTTLKDDFYRYTGPVLNYSPCPLSKGMWIQSHGLLIQKGVKKLNPKPGKWNNLPVLFKTGPGPDLPFDLFAGIFFLVSRYEEYLDFKPDHVGRFPSQHSVAYQNSFLDMPVVDNWANSLKNILKIRYPELNFRKRSFEFISTIDVDQAWAYLHKGVARNIAGGLKFALKGDFADITKRTQTLVGQRKDPFDAFQYLFDSQQDIKVNYFIQVGKYGKFDKNHSGRNRAMKKLIRNLAEHTEIGIHPSMRSGPRGELKEELDLLSNVLGIKIVKSRQHYIYLRFPKTYRNLIQHGIEEEYSMGYPDRPGFRAGTATPFYFYDLLEENVTKLKIYPFQLMDSCLNNNLKLTPDEAIDIFKEYIEKVKKVHGTFISIWHNSSLSNEAEWIGWREVFENMLHTGKG